MYAKAIGKKLNVYWPNDTCCNGFFLDYFERVDGIAFYRDDFLNGKKYDVFSCGWHADFNPREHFLLAPLKPLPYIQSIIDEKVSSLKNYCSVHIRQTDFFQVQQAHDLPILSDSYFIRKIKQLDLNNYNYIYVAADNRKSQLVMEEVFPGKIKYYEVIEPKETTRQTSLEHAIIDLYICANADIFIETTKSSFSSTINQLRAGWAGTTLTQL